MTTTVIVDDELDMRMLVRVILDLSSEGFDIVGEATDGAEAVDVLASFGPEIPDIVVLDNRMPNKTGIEAAREIKAARPDQIVVLYSAYLDDVVIAEAAEAGIARCVAKTDLHQLPEILKSLLRPA